VRPGERGRSARALREGSQRLRELGARDALGDRVGLVVERLLEAARERGVERALRARQRDRRRRGETRGQRVRLREREAVVDEAIHQASGQRVGRGDPVAEEHELLGAVESHQPGQEPAPSRVDRQAAVDEHLAEARRAAGDDQVAAEGEVRAGAGRAPLDRRDAGLRQLVERQAGGTDALAHRAAGALRSGPAVSSGAGEIAPRAELAAGARQHDHAVVARARGAVQRLGEGPPGRDVDRVPALGAVERQGDHAARALDAERVHLPSLRLLPRSAGW
jgi:hypothetical protein